MKTLMINTVIEPRLPRREERQMELEMEMEIGIGTEIGIEMIEMERDRDTEIKTEIEKARRACSKTNVRDWLYKIQKAQEC